MKMKFKAAALACAICLCLPLTANAAGWGQPGGNFFSIFGFQNCSLTDDEQDSLDSIAQTYAEEEAALQISIIEQLVEEGLIDEDTGDEAIAEIEAALEAGTYLTGTATAVTTTTTTAATTAASTKWTVDNDELDSDEISDLTTLYTSIWTLEQEYLQDLADADLLDEDNAATMIDSIQDRIDELDADDADTLPDQLMLQGIIGLRLPTEAEDSSDTTYEDLATAYAEDYADIINEIAAVYETAGVLDSDDVDDIAAALEDWIDNLFTTPSAPVGTFNYGSAQSAPGSWNSSNAGGSANQWNAGSWNNGNGMSNGNGMNNGNNGMNMQGMIFRSGH